ncbi:hypothetical protein Ahy_A06g030016 isoform A [Arachis hypogaea]|uniref:Uncharacterized protein n=1 Tax=Arachis hypogaea TaxID=3818 RepID=A0A445CUZ5_ARAHY|nr:hypothetical protein Ahy_A06g030016 isoform A [Arachis hypogaea]
MVFATLLPKSIKEVETETLASPPPPQGLPPSVALSHYHRRLVVRTSSSFKNRSFFFLDLGASVSGIHLLHRAPAAVRRTLNHHRLRLVVANSFNPPPSSELCSSPGLCLRHDSAPLFSDCSEEKPISIPVSFLRGVISEEKVDSFNVPLIYPSVKAVKEILRGCDECFSIEWMEILEFKNMVSLPIGQIFVSWFRAALQRTIEKHFGAKIVDKLFERFAEKVKEFPDIMNTDKLKLDVLFVLLRRKNKARP